jgi:hypothetical protein
MRSLLLAAAKIVAIGSLAGCGAARPPKPKDPRPIRVVKAPQARPTLPGPAALPAHVLATLDDQEAAPYFARRGDEGLVLYATGGHWRTRRMGADGAPLDAGPSDVGVIGGEVTVGTLRAVGEGYVAAWAELAGQNHALRVQRLDAKGQAQGAPSLITQSPDELSYVDVLPNAKGALVLWELPRDQRSDLFAVPLIAGKVVGSPVTLVRGALGWEAVATERGAAVVVVTPDPARADDDDAQLGRVELTEADAMTARPSAPVVLSAESTAQIDPQIVELGGRYVIAWTDERELDASVYVATIGVGGKDRTSPRRATAPLGEQALVALVAEPMGKGKRALLAWEDLLRARPDGRPIHLATLGPDASVGDARATLLFSANGPPDLVADGDGFAALTLAPAQLTSDAAPTKLNVLPAFVRFTKDLTVKASEPIRAEAFALTEGIPYLTQSLTCGSTSCTLLASGTGDAAPLAAVALPVRDNPWRSPAWRDADDLPPHPTRVTSIYDGDKLSHVASVETATGALTGWLTYVLGEGDPGMTQGKDEPPGAVLSLRSVTRAGALGEPVEISKRAVSVGRLAMSTATTGKPETAVAWVGRSKDGPQVFVTKVDADGKKLAQKAVTVIARKGRAGPSSQVSDVAIAYDGNDAWTLAWVDTRDHNAEIYVAKVDRTLKKIVPDRRVTTALGDAAEVSLQVRGKDTFLAWSDARGDVEGGTGDIYVAHVDTRTLQKVGVEARLFASVAHSRSPMLATTPSGLGVAWLEESSGGTSNRSGEASAADAEAGVRIAWLDAEGRLLGAPFRVRPEPSGAVTSVAMTCDKVCRGVFTAAHGPGLSMSAFEVKPGAEVVTQRAIATLTGGLAEDVSPAFPTRQAETLFFADDALGGTSRVRWMTIGWK